MDSATGPVPGFGRTPSPPVYRMEWVNRQPAYCERPTAPFFPFGASLLLAALSNTCSGWYWDLLDQAVRLARLHRRVVELPSGAERAGWERYLAGERHRVRRAANWWYLAAVRDIATRVGLYREIVQEARARAVAYPEGHFVGDITADAAASRGWSASRG